MESDSYSPDVLLASARQQLCKKYVGRLFIDQVVFEDAPWVSLFYFIDITISSTTTVETLSGYTAAVHFADS